MKTLREKWTLSLFFMVAVEMAVYSQGMNVEVPGDHFSLEGALELFKKAASPQDFEQKLNSPETKVNNLDLNGDGYIDYIRVIDRNEGAVHVFVLQAMISGNESQDVAVIELEKLDNGKAVLQITGDADVYGVETIIEPTEEIRINAGTSSVRTIVNVWYWPSVQYIYSPYYTPWTSPWHWSYRPIGWRPWRPLTYRVYYSRWEYYQPYYTTCHTHRVVYAQDLYRPHRKTSAVVHSRHHAQITHYRSSRHEAENNRSRNDHSRVRDQQSENTYQREITNRSRPNHLQHGNSRSSADHTVQRQENNHTRSFEVEKNESSNNRSFRNLNNVPVSQRKEHERQSPQLSQGRLSDVNANRVSRQRETRTVAEPRSNQRQPVVHTERRASSESRSAQRPSKENDRSNFMDHKREKD